VTPDLCCNCANDDHRLFVRRTRNLEARALSPAVIASGLFAGCRVSRDAAVAAAAAAASHACVLQAPARNGCMLDG